jgi:hypothetical protein
MKKNIYITLIIIAAFLLVAVYIFFKINNNFIMSNKIESTKSTENNININPITQSNVDIGIIFDTPLSWNKVDSLSSGFMLNSPDEKSLVIISKSQSTEVVSNDSSAKEDLDNAVNSLLDPFKDSKNYKLISDISTKIANLGARDISFSYRDRDGLYKVRLLVTEKYKGSFYYFSLYSNEFFEKDMLDFDKILKSVKFK